MEIPIITTEIRTELDIVHARQRTRQVAALIGFGPHDLTRICTAVSEIARNAFQYAAGGKVEFLLGDGRPAQVFLIRISDNGPGIQDLKGVLEGGYVSRTGMGLGVTGARRLMDHFEIFSTPGRGTTVVLGKELPPKVRRLSVREQVRIAGELERFTPQSPLEELRQQNSELLRALGELTQLNLELESTNRGVVALYTELDEKAARIQQADELKSRFLSYTSHELRTPINSIMSLSRILLDRTDGELSEEQEKQVDFIRTAAEHLREMIDELLDLAKIEAGKTVVHPNEFEASELFAALQGMARPLLANRSVQLIFEEPAEIPPFNSDEGKISQILRNMVSNALKFTQQGEIRVSATLSPEGRAVAFSVADTGIGVPPEDHERIFEEYAQIDKPVGDFPKGTGLGLSLSRKLAELLGGSLSVKSERGVGSTFTALIPLIYQRAPKISSKGKIGKSAEPGPFPVLVVEDEPDTMLMYQTYFKNSPFSVIPAYTLAQARQALRKVRPLAIVLDVLLAEENGFEFLVEVKEKKSTRDIPVVVVTILNHEHQKAMLLGAHDYFVKPVSRARLLKRLSELTPAEKILIIDDEEMDRYSFRKILKGTPHTLLEAGNGSEGLRVAREEHPQVIFLDLIMPGMDGFEVLSRLKSDPDTETIPVVVFTSKDLDEKERKRLRSSAQAILFKQRSSRETIIAKIGDLIEQIRKDVLQKMEGLDDA